MTSNKEISTDSSTDFVLKNRITGAAFLICFGALFLPWLLGAPSEASKDQTEQTARSGGEITPDQIEQELLTVVDNAQIENVEVYVSKITPLDVIPDSDAVSEETVVVKPEPEPTPVKEATVAESAEKKETAAEPKVIVEQKPEEVDEKPVQEIVKVAEQAMPSVVVSPVIANKVEVGWVVQVGVFTDSSGAEKVVTDLKSRGFSPSVTIVDTNRGKASGTRVWLGPYAQRVEAAKSMSTLKEKTGSDGFIRAYP